MRLIHLVSRSSSAELVAAGYEGGEELAVQSDTSVAILLCRSLWSDLFWRMIYGFLKR